MSTDYDIYCLQCNDRCGFQDAKHQAEMMRELIREAPALAEIAKAYKKLESGYLEIHFQYYHGASIEWFADHEGHTLVVRDEYGRLDDECQEKFTCGDCKRVEWCKRPSGHDGKHSIKRNPTS